MSMIGSLLAFVLIPLKARPQPAQDLALEYWRDSYDRVAAENEQLRRECIRLRGRLEMFNRLERIPQRAAPQGLAGLGQSPQELLTQMAQAQYHQQAQQAQALAMQNQQAQLANYHQGLGMQNIYDCTCVPARSDMLRRAP